MLHLCSHCLQAVFASAQSEQISSLPLDLSAPTTVCGPFSWERRFELPSWFSHFHSPQAGSEPGDEGCDDDDMLAAWHWGSGLAFSWPLLVFLVVRFRNHRVSPLHLSSEIHLSSELLGTQQGRLSLTACPWRWAEASKTSSGQNC